MITDIFSRRYRDVLIREYFDLDAKRLLFQGFHIICTQLFPDYSKKDGERSNPTARDLWEGLHNQLALEIGLDSLSPPFHPHTSIPYPKITVCKNFVCAKYDRSYPITQDQFIKERLSFIELAFRKREEQIAKANNSLEKEITEGIEKIEESYTAFPNRKLSLQEAIESRTIVLRAKNAKINRDFRFACKELNERLRLADFKLDYHNGFIQISPDALTTDHIERPFWDLVSNRKWANVDEEMKTAIDLRDTSGPDPEGYAAKALESTIKIICNEKGWTHGKENGPHNWLDNLLAKKNGPFINTWECNILKGFFSDVRNPSAHGAGKDKISKLEHWQTDWAIEFCMSWIKNLIRRM